MDNGWSSIERCKSCQKQETAEKEIRGQGVHVEQVPTLEIPEHVESFRSNERWIATVVVVAFVALFVVSALVGVALMSQQPNNSGAPVVVSAPITKP